MPIIIKDNNGCCCSGFHLTQLQRYDVMCHVRETKTRKGGIRILRRYPSEGMVHLSFFDSEDLTTGSILLPFSISSKEKFKQLAELAAACAGFVAVPVDNPKYYNATWAFEIR